jgi:hypothetical protein
VPLCSTFFNGNLSGGLGKSVSSVVSLIAANFGRGCPSATALHASCRDLIEAVGLDPSKYSTHSAKRGSATAAVVAGCRDAEVTALGRWRSAETRKGYVHGSDKFRKILSFRFSV